MDKRYFEMPDEVVCVNKADHKPLQRPDPDFKPSDDKPKERAPLIDDMPWTLERYLLAWVLCRPEWNKGIKMQRLSARIMAAVEDVAPGAVVAIPAEAWRKLKEAFDSDDFEVSWPLGPQLAHYADVIIDAADKPAAMAAVDGAAE